MQFEFLSLLNSSFFQCHESARVGFRSFVCTHFVTRDIKFLHSTINSTTRIIHENSKMYFSWGHFCVRSPSKWLCDIFKRGQRSALLAIYFFSTFIFHYSSIFHIIQSSSFTFEKFVLLYILLDHSWSYLIILDHSWSFLIQ